MRKMSWGLMSQMRTRAAISLVLLAATSLPANWQNKVSEIVKLQAAQGEVGFLVILREQADLADSKNQVGKLAKGAWVVAHLRAIAARTQPSILHELAMLDLVYQPFWVANMILVYGDLDVVANLAQRVDVARIVANSPMQQALPPLQLEDFQGSQLSWGVEKINAMDVWAMGFTGQGVVIGGQDTGFDWDHAALIDQYRGWNGSTFDHNYNWHDAIHSGGGTCGANSPQPCDDGSHGTHTMGTMVGDDGLGNQTGVAPGAAWIGCRNMDQGNGTPATYAECFQWFLAPTDLAGDNPDPTRAPHVINNSWSCPAVEGCIDPEALLMVVENTRAAGIFVVAATGNSGSGCSSVNTPPAIYGASFSVGATTSSDSAAGFSSRGPVSVDGSFRLKPDIAAPGTSIRSTIPGDNYGNKSGTSMAGPHVAGLVALILSAAPDLAGDIDRIEEIIRITALPLTSTQDCGGFPGNVVPNAVFGWGRIRADKAVEEALGVRLPDCLDFPAMLASWPLPTNGFPDTNGNQVMDIIDLVPLAACPLGP